MAFLVFFFAFIGVAFSAALADWIMYTFNSPVLGFISFSGGSIVSIVWVSYMGKYCD